MRIIGTSSRPRKDTLASRNQARHGRLEEELNSDEVPRRGRSLPAPPDVVAEAGRPPPRASAQSGQKPPLFVCLFGPEGAENLSPHRRERSEPGREEAVAP